MRELGRRGGRTPKMTALRRAAAEQDDQLRELARETLERSLRGEKVDSQQLAAAKSLFSYRADAPPSPTAAAQGSSGKPIGLAELLEAAAESKVLSQLGLDPDSERALLKRLRARNPASEGDDAAHTRPTPPLLEEKVSSL